jgi:hypothetical protein
MMSLGISRTVSRPQAPRNVVELDSQRPVPIRFIQSEEVPLRTRGLIRYHQIVRTTAMRTRFVSFGGAALLVTAVGFVAASAGSTERSAPGGQRSAAPAPSKPAAPAMVVYKSPT